MGNRGNPKDGNRGGGGGSQFQMMVPFKGAVKKLVILHVAIWLVLQVIIEQFILKTPWITATFGLEPGQVLAFHLWQPLTYIFLHEVGPFHILFNMLALWWLGSELETQWGSRFFTVYYLVCGVGAAIIYSLVTVLYALVTGHMDPLYMPVIGASGAVFGLMLAYGIIFGERMVYFMFVFPMKAKMFVLILGAVEVVMLLNQGIGNGKVANLAHLGGIISGYLFLLFFTYWNKRRKQKPSGGGRRLRLVVDNEEEKDPKYWN